MPPDGYHRVVVGRHREARRAGDRQQLRPGDRAFAVASTTYPAPTTTGSCLLTNAAYDLSKGVGWYLTGTMHLPTAPKPQTASPKPPKRIKPKGKTVLLKKTVVTNAGQTATAKVTWSTKKSAMGNKARFASVTTSKAGKVTITTTRKAKKFYV